MVDENARFETLPTVETRLHFAATVLLEKRLVQRKFWHSHAWYLDTVAMGDDVSEAEIGGELAYTKATGDVFRWSGYQVTLYKDACERYWHSLISDDPKIYVVCRDSDSSSCLLYTSPSPRDKRQSRMPSSA